MAYNKAWRRNRALVLQLADSTDSDSDCEGSVHLIAEPDASTAEGTSLSEDTDNTADSSSALTYEADINGSSSETENSNRSSHQLFTSDTEVSSDSSDVDSNPDLLSDSDDKCTSEEQPQQDNSTFADKLAILACKKTSRVSREFLGELLSLLRAEGLDVPKDPRTLLRTPRRVYASEKCGGQYSYFGIQSCITDCLNLNKWYVEKHDSIDLVVNVDGIPLFKSNSDQFWPILIAFGPFRPLVVCLFLGNHKPSSAQEFLEDFLQEYASIKESGIAVCGKRMSVSIEHFSCDVPARAFLKCSKGHSGYFSCERCDVRGAVVEGRMTFATVDNTKRTDAGFHAMQYDGTHQLGRSPLLDIDFPCVSGFSLDYMHLVCLGVVRRMLTYLKKGPRLCRLSKHQLGRINESLQEFRGQLPSEFARQPRGLDDLDHWKATEFRQFLLYTGPLVLKDVLAPEVFQHFLKLSVGISILLDSDDNRRHHYLDFSSALLSSFVLTCPEIFGPTFSVFNVHSLCHLADDASNFSRSLNSLSCFAFENHLQIIKKSVRNANMPIVQVAKRLREKFNVSCGDDLRVSNNFKKISVFSQRKKDSCFIVGDCIIFVIKKKKHGFYVCDSVKQSRLEPLFTLKIAQNVRCESTKFGIGYLKACVTKHKKILNEKNFERKVVCLPYRDGLALIPLLHPDEH